jgi:nucleoid DNA-binding protein
MIEEKCQEKKDKIMKKNATKKKGGKQREVNLRELTKRVGRNRGVTYRFVKPIVRAVFEELNGAFIRGERVTLDGFGQFQPRVRHHKRYDFHSRDVFKCWTAYVYFSLSKSIRDLMREER